MKQNPKGLHLGFFLAIISIILTGCATNSISPWIENDERIGNIWKNKKAYGAEWRYRNAAGQLQRIEQHDQNDILLPGASVTQFFYDPKGKLAEEVSCDALFAPTVNGQGYVFKKYTYSVSDSGDQVEAQAFLDIEKNPVGTTQGYAVSKLIHDRATRRVKEVFLEDPWNKPASGIWDGVNGVARIKYTVLEGIGEVRCGVYYAPSGEIVDRKTVEGRCSYSSQQKTITTYYHGGGSPP